MAPRQGTRASERIKAKPSVSVKPPTKKAKGPPKVRTEGRAQGAPDPSDPESPQEAGEENGEPLDLSSLLALPLDVFQEVLSHLHPRDLILVSRVSRRFREHLLLKNSTVWRRSRERIGAPDGPSHLSESAWAALLFLPRCQTCGEPDVQIVDFFILRRLCASCRKKSLVNREIFENSYPEYPVEVLELVPYTTMQISFRSPIPTQGSGRVYSLEDIKEVASKLKAYTQAASTSVAGQDKTKLEIFKAYQEAKTRTILKSAANYQSWFHTYYIKQHIHGNMLSL